MYYYIIVQSTNATQKGEKQMSKKKKQKKGDKNSNLEKVVLITAILNLIDKLVDIIQKLTD